MDGVVVVFVLFTSFLLLVRGHSDRLRCIEGGQITPSSLPDIQFQERTCPDKQQCIKGTAVVDPKSPHLNNDNVTLLAATCVDAKTCIANRECSDVVGEVIEAFGRQTLLKAELLSIRSCDYVCCKTNNCNQETIAEIRKRNASATISVHSYLTMFCLIFLTFFMGLFETC
ncbi:unnamed protein product [Clavelina lepadiformis]|uniref:Uncharacterized protein n=1 Tax=Clavelina lepadiformis TaxID=159417 RepID=A0ABP0FXN2_CLALP